MKYNFQQAEESTLTVNSEKKQYIAEPLEAKLSRLLTNKEDIGKEVKPVYTERKDGVPAQYDIRADKWDIALDAMTAASKSNTAEREKKIKAKEEAKVIEMNKAKPEEISKTEPVDGTKQ